MLGSLGLLEWLEGLAARGSFALSFAGDVFGDGESRAGTFSAAVVVVDLEGVTAGTYVALKVGGGAPEGLGAPVTRDMTFGGDSLNTFL